LERKAVSATNLSGKKELVSKEYGSFLPGARKTEEGTGNGSKMVV
jgi:hypothetical protein